MRASGTKTTYVRAGSYFLATTLSLTSSDSGASLLAYPGERPVLSGGRAITGFAQNGNLWTATIPPAQLAGWTLTALNVGGSPHLSTLVSIAGASNVVIQGFDITDTAVAENVDLTNGYDERSGPSFRSRPRPRSPSALTGFSTPADRASRWRPRRG